MPMRDHFLSGYRFRLWFVKKAIEDVPEAQIAEQPSPGMNHPAWILGHLALERLFFKNLLKLDLPAPAGWEALFARGTVPTADRSKYPSKAQLIAALEETHAAVERAFTALTDADLEQENPSEAIRPFFPKTGDVLVGLLPFHGSLHVGQITAWRRAMGFKSIF